MISLTCSMHSSDTMAALAPEFLKKNESRSPRDLGSMGIMMAPMVVPASREYTNSGSLRMNTAKVSPSPMPLSRSIRAILFELSWSF